MQRREENLSRATQTVTGVIVTALLLVPFVYLEYLSPLPILARLVIVGAVAYALSIFALSLVLKIQNRFKK